MKINEEIAMRRMTLIKFNTCYNDDNIQCNINGETIYDIPFNLVNYSIENEIVDLFQDITREYIHHFHWYYYKELEDDFGLQTIKGLSNILYDEL